MLFIFDFDNKKILRNTIQLNNEFIVPITMFFLQLHALFWDKIVLVESQ